jgi:hypothetical protein
MSRVMSNDWPMDAQFWEQLTRIDLLWGERVREGGCEGCGGPLDRADYPRKPRGGLGEGAAEHARRVSFCCRRDGCRQRSTPPSVRFLGRKVYVGALVIVASMVGRAVLAQGRQLRRPVEGVPSRTVGRWLSWWQTVFALSPFWLEAKSFFASPVEIAQLPASLLSRFGAGTSALKRLLGFLAPTTTTSVRARIAMVE